MILSGQVIDQFGGHPLPGLTVLFDGKTVKTGADGRFEIPGTASTTVKPLTISGPGVYKRVARTASGDQEWRVVSSSFNMTAYDDVARQESGTSTIRWVAFPTVYVNTKPEGFTHPDVPKWVEEIKVQAAEFVAKWTGGVIQPAAVIATASPPSDLSAGTIVIHLSENSADYGGYAGAIGWARRSTLSDRSIVAGTVNVRYKGYVTNPNKRKGLLGHELGHVLGLGHMSGTGTGSLMAPSIGSKTGLLAFDALIASLSYTRPPNTASPDTLGTSGGKRKLAAKTGVVTMRHWVCGK